MKTKTRAKFPVIETKKKKKQNKKTCNKNTYNYLQNNLFQDLDEQNFM